MLELEGGRDDSHEFLHIAARLMAGAAKASGLSVVWTGHVDGFFGQTWLGFRGKLLGQVGLHNRSLSDGLAMPPIPVKRILSTHYYVRDELDQFQRAKPPWSRILGRYASSTNVNSDILSKGLYAWYSGDSAVASKGAVMVYAIKEGKNAAWYTMWENKPPWKLVRNVGIATRTCRHFINLGTHPSAI